MRKVYCKHCGMRAISKCPHCRTVFTTDLPYEIEIAQDWLKVRLVQTVDENGKVRLFSADAPPELAGKPIQHHEVFFEVYRKATDSEAIRVILDMARFIADIDPRFYDVLACVHQWELLPGEKCTGDCKSVGPEVGVPVNPFPKGKATRVVKRTRKPKTS